MTMSRTDIWYLMPRPWFNEPICELTRERYIREGYLDSNGNITQKGKEDIHLTQEELQGTETREHYEEYLKHWNEFEKKLDEWAADERIPEEQKPVFDYKETWDSEK